MATRHPKARTVALLGRSGVGKTTLLEAMLVATGGLVRPGRIEEGTTVCGTDPEERRHQTSLAIAMAPVWIGDDKLTLLDTPGLVDFYGEVERALDVADVAVLVVTAVDAVQNDTIVLWRLAREAGVPVVVFVNALDAERASFETTLSALERLVGPSLAPVELPIGEGPAFSGVVDLLTNEALHYSDGKPAHGPVPDGLAELEQRVRASLLEAIVVGDDRLTEQYLEGDEPELDELEMTLGHLMTEGRIVPVVLGSAVRAIGVDRLTTLLDEIAESRPIPAIENGEPVMLERDPEADVVLRAFKVIVDPYVGRIVVFEVVAGTLRSDAVLTNTRTQTDERIHGMGYLVGSKMTPLDEAVTGAVVAVAKLNHVLVGDILTKRGRNLQPVPVAAHTPAMSVAIMGAASDDEKIATALRVRHDPIARHLVADVMGEMHLQVTLERLHRRFNLELSTAPPPVPLYETILAPATVEGRLKKQTGGHGQYAVVNVTVEPLDPMTTFEFVDAVVGGAVPRQYIGAVRNGIERAMAHGGPNGQPVVGVRATLFDGKSHSVDSSEAAFETAGSLALRAALEQAGCALLERIMAVTATVPAEYLGDVLTDLSSRRGRVIGTDQSEDGDVVIVAHVPEAELVRYGLDLRRLTGGRGQVTIEAHHLTEAPKTVSTK